MIASSIDKHQIIKLAAEIYKQLVFVDNARLTSKDAEISIEWAETFYEVAESKGYGNNTLFPWLAADDPQRADGAGNASAGESKEQEADNYVIPGEIENWISRQESPCGSDD